MADTDEKGTVVPGSAADAGAGHAQAPAGPVQRGGPSAAPDPDGGGADGHGQAGLEGAGEPGADMEERLALAARIAGEQIQLVPRGYVFALSAILLALLGLVGWSVFGSVPSSVRLTGVLVHGDGPRPVPAPAAGTVVSVAVQPGEAVKRGQAVASVQTPSGGRSPVTAPADGTVLGVVSAPGTAVSPGTPVVSLDLTGGGLTGWLFVKADKGYPAPAGSPVTARLSSGDSVVTVDGTVRGVGGYPMTGAEISRLLGGLPARLAVPDDGPYRLVAVSIHALGVTGSARLSLDGEQSSRVPALIPLVADVRTGSIRPIDALVGGQG